MTQDTHTTDLTILNTKIRRDAEGRYNLNDCHRAAGATATTKPSNWLRSEQAKALVAEVANCSDLSSLAIKEGRAGGTFVAKELVYAYAMWVSPKFHLTVIRAFDALVQQRATGSFRGLTAPEVAEVVRSEIAVVLSSYDPTGGFTTDYAPIRRFVDEAVPNPKGRGALTRRCAIRCRKWLIARGLGDKMRLSRETDRILFQVDAANDWMAAEGRTLARAHVDKIAGQAVMRLVVPRRASHA